MKRYFIELKIQAGEYEKSTSKVVNADTEEEAKHNALLGECHYDEKDLFWDDRGVYDCGGEFHYSVQFCEEIPEKDWETLSIYMRGI